MSIASDPHWSLSDGVFWSQQLDSFLVLAASSTLAAPHVPDALLLTILTRGPHFHTHNAPIPTVLPFIHISQYPKNTLIWIHALHASDWSNWQYCNAAAGELARGPHLHNHNAPYLLSYHSYTIPPIPPNSIGNTPQYPPNTLIWEHALHAHDWSNWQCRY